MRWVFFENGYEVEREATIKEVLPDLILATVIWGTLVALITFAGDIP